MLVEPQVRFTASVDFVFFLIEERRQILFHQMAATELTLQAREMGFHGYVLVKSVHIEKNTRYVNVYVHCLLYTSPSPRDS